MNNRIKGWIIATAVVAIVGVPLTVSAQADPPQAQPAQQAATASGELTKVDVTAKTITVKADLSEFQRSIEAAMDAAQTKADDAAQVAARKLVERIDAALG